MDIKNVISKKWTPVFIAVGIAVAAAGYYVFSGQGSLDLKTRELSRDEKIEEVDLSNRQRIKIKCRNGETYEIVFTRNQADFDELIFDSCGVEGGEVEENNAQKS